MINHCKKGYSVASFLSQIGISYQRWSVLCYENDILQEAIEVAQASELYYWERVLIDGINGDDKQLANVARGMLSERADLYEKVYKRNVNTSTPKDIVKRRVTLAQGERNRDILDSDDL